MTAMADPTFSRQAAALMNSEHVLALPPSQQWALRQGLAEANSVEELPEHLRMLFEEGLHAQITEARFEERLHPRGRAGRFVRRMWHLGPTEHRGSIEQHGIDYTRSGGRASGNYLWDNLEDVKRYRQFWGGRTFDLYEVEAHGLPVERDPLVPQGAWLSGETIGPERVRRVEPGEKADPGASIFEGDTLRDVYDGFEHNGLTAHVVESAVSGRGVASADGLIADGDRKVGTFRNEVQQEGDRLRVHHDALYLDPEYQGRGFGTAFLNHSLSAYQRLGVDHVTLQAAGQVGGYQWATRGFDFNLGRYSILAAGALDTWHLEADERFARAYAVHELWLKRGERFAGERKRGRVPDDQWQEFAARFPTRAMLNAYAAGDQHALDDTFESPASLATWGRGVHTWTEAADPVSLGHTMWLGKRFLLGATWRGEYRLAGRVEEAVMDGTYQTKMEQVVREVADEWTRDGRLTSPPDRLADDAEFWAEVDRRLNEAA